MQIVGSLLHQRGPVAPDLRRIRSTHHRVGRRRVSHSPRSLPRPKARASVSWAIRSRCRRPDSVGDEGFEFFEGRGQVVA